MEYNLEGRTADFSINTLKLLRDIKITTINKNTVDQLIRSSTSIGANYREANGASSRNDFRNKIHICKKEAQETKYWLEILRATEIPYESKLRELWNEAQELTLIFNKICKSTAQKQ